MPRMSLPDWYAMWMPSGLEFLGSLMVWITLGVWLRETMAMASLSWQLTAANLELGLTATNSGSMTPGAWPMASTSPAALRNGSGLCRMACPMGAMRIFPGVEALPSASSATITQRPSGETAILSRWIPIFWSSRIFFSPRAAALRSRMTNLRCWWVRRRG